VLRKRKHRHSQRTHGASTSKGSVRPQINATEAIDADRAVAEPRGAGILDVKGRQYDVR
jgi:hypothetical protein